MTITAVTDMMRLQDLMSDSRTEMVIPMLDNGVAEAKGGFDVNVCAFLEVTQVFFTLLSEWKGTAV